MNKKGFTLIELLAVIVILAVIALIASPIILGIIQNSRESSMARSVEGYAAGVAQAITSAMSDPDYMGGDVIVSDDGQIAKVGLQGQTGYIEKPVSYSGSQVHCEVVNYDDETGFLQLEGCSVSGSTIQFRFYDNPNNGKDQDGNVIVTTKGAAVRITE